MKRIVSPAALAACLAILTGSCNHQTTKTMEKNANGPVLGLGQPVTDNFTGEAWLNMLSAHPNYDCNIYNVTFAPGTRNHWHRHSVGQILLCTEGVGYYQERGEPARRLTTGEVVNIPANVVHWHGASPQERFTHIGITPKAGENAVEWLGAVSDEQYAEATSQL